jgi:acetyltransferase
MALIARPAVEGTALGIVRFAADPDNRRGEFAVSVRSDWKGRGLGYLLMTRIIEVARQRDLGEIFGEVLRENGAMLRVARALGFSVTTHPQEAHLLRLTKPL